MKNIALATTLLLFTTLLLGCSAIGRELPTLVPTATEQAAKVYGLALLYNAVAYFGGDCFVTVEDEFLSIRPKLRPITRLTNGTMSATMIFMRTVGR